MELWPHQKRALAEIADARRRGVQRLLITAPTGAGKTEIMFNVARSGERVVFYLHRRILIDQFIERLKAAGLPFGVRAAGSDHDFSQPIQIASLQTDYERTFKAGAGGWDLHPADVAFVDEAHDQKGEMALAVIDRHSERGEFVCGMTATPIECGHYDELVQVATNADLRRCGALLPSTTYAPEEPAAPRLRINSSGGYSEKEVDRAAKLILTGNIIAHWKRLNPDALPAVGFAHSVEASLGHAQEFWKAGIPAAHIDGQDTWINGEWHFTDTTARHQLEQAMRAGEVKVVWNRFVLREGVDWPFLYHGIFATVFGSLTAYIQAGGRVLRNAPGLDHVIFQDHGGNWWRHGSLNESRTWHLEDSMPLLAKKRQKRLREKKDPDPICCPKCQATREFGRACPQCGHVSRRGARFIRQTNGSLKETTGDIYKPRRISRLPQHVRTWERVYWRCWNSGRSFEQAFALFARENNWVWPDPNWPLMPVRDGDSFKAVRNVPIRMLTSYPERKAEPCLF